jgi:hypothetical protein
VVGVLFILTGVAIVVYLNQTPLQPRERDYAYAGSFYAFAIWIGLGILGIIDMIGRKARNLPAAVAVTIICLALVPALMAKENWDDHDRSGRYMAREIAYNYLNSCKPNAILFTGGDNDTFPLWYAQEVEGIRTDVRVVNLMLLNMDWYIDQMKNRAYESAPLPIKLESEKYINGTRDAIPIVERIETLNDVKQIISFIANDTRNSKLQSHTGQWVDYVPTRSFYIPVDSAKLVENGWVKPEDASLIEDRIIGRISGNYLSKSNFAALDLIRNNNWKRPIYFVGTNHTDELGLSDYLQLDGLAYQLVPIKSDDRSSFERGRIDTDILYDNLMNKFTYRSLNDEKVYLDHFHRRTLSVIRLRFRFMRLAMALTEEGDYERAGEVLDRIIELMPHESLPYGMFMPGIADAYLQIGQTEKAVEILEKMLDIAEDYLEYYFSFGPKQITRINSEMAFYLRVVGNTYQMSRQYKLEEINERAERLYNLYGNNFNMMR